MATFSGSARPAAFTPAGLEAADHCIEALSFLAQGLCSRSRLLDHGRILLCHLIHLLTGSRDLAQTHGLIGSIITATVGAIVLLYLVRLFKRA